MTKHRLKTSPFWAIAVVAALGMGLSACGGGDSNEGLSLTEENKLKADKEAADAAKEKAEADAAAEKKRADDLQKEKDAAAAADALAMAKALHGAIGRAAGPTTVAIGTTLDIDPAGTPVEVAKLKAGESAGALGSWNGMNYAYTNTGTKDADSAIVYTNRAAPTSKAFADMHSLDQIPVGGKNTALRVAAANIGKVMADAFTHSGTQGHEKADKADAVYVRGFYDGAPGEYRCADATCTSTNDGKGSPNSLDGTWDFTPDAGAMVSMPDPNYLAFGWWLRKDKDGTPTMVSAFFTEVGDVEGGGTMADPDTIPGSATYAGKAAGKFAINNPLGGSDAGHFTADVMLTATFGSGAATGTAGVSGMIDNFMANDESVPWSVALNRAPWDTSTAGAFATPTDNEPSTPADETKGTVWSIDGNAASPSGKWNGQMHDEALEPAAGSDGSNVPTAAVGMFESQFGSTHSMVGAFGAEKN